MRLGTLGLALALGSAQSLSAQPAAVALRVIDSASTAPLADVRISIVGVAGEGLTDAGGRFFYTAPRPGPLVLVVRRLGFSPGLVTVNVAAGDTLAITYPMSAVPQSLATVTVQDSIASKSRFLSGFERRLANRLGGAYITRAEIEKRRPMQTTDLLRRIPSLEIRDSSGVAVAVSGRMKKLVSRAGPAGTSVEVAECVVQVAVNGSFKEWGFDLNAIPPHQIHGIEVYPGPATIPAEYALVRRDAYCGAILIWTRVDK